MASLCLIILAVSLVESAGGRDFQSHMGEKQMSASRIACMGAAAYETTVTKRIKIVTMYNFMVIELSPPYSVLSQSSDK
jgi:predicted metal-binding membrane protein